MRKRKPPPPRAKAVLAKAPPPNKVAMPDPRIFSAAERSEDPEPLPPAPEPLPPASTVAQDEVPLPPPAEPVIEPPMPRAPPWTDTGDMYSTGVSRANGSGRPRPRSRIWARFW